MSPSLDGHGGKAEVQAPHVVVMPRVQLLVLTLMTLLLPLALPPFSPLLVFLFHYSSQSSIAWYSMYGVLVFYAACIVYHALKVRSYHSRYYSEENCSLGPLSPATLKSLDVLINDEEFDKCTQHILSLPNPEYGIHGKDSTSWRMNREAIIFMGGGKAALMQAAHPFVGTAVYKQSALGAGVQERFYRTFKHVLGMAFGDTETSVRHARQVRKIHSSIAGKFEGAYVGPFGWGDHYSAHHQGAVIWVHSTLVESAVFVYEMMIEELSLSFKNEILNESHNFLRLFGVEPMRLPFKTWTEFMDYNRRMWNTDEVLAVGKAGWKIESFLFTSPFSMFQPVVGSIRLIAACMLPPSVREKFGYRITTVDLWMFYFKMAAYRLIWSYLPESMRFLSRYLEAESRVGVQRHFISRWLSGLAAMAARALLFTFMPPRPVEKKLHQE